MASLTETAFYTRKGIRWGAVVFIGLIVLRISFDILVTELRRAFPPPPLKINNYFGKLPKIIFPESASPSGQLLFTLQTISGSVPRASDAARVYFMPKNKANLLSLSKAQAFVGKLGFTTTPRQISTTLYRWIDLRSPLRTIEMDIVSNHFKLSYSFVQDLTLFAERQIPSPQVAISETLTFFQLVNLPTQDLAWAKPVITYLKLVGDQLEPTTSQSQADAVRLNLFRRDYDGVKVLTDDPQKSVVTVVFSGSKRSDKRILSIDYAYWPLDAKNTGAYKLKSSETAWKELQAGNAYLAKLPANQTQIAITNIYLAYYDSREPQLFLQPVFVFEAEDKFRAYVPAVAPPWTE